MGKGLASAPASALCLQQELWLSKLCECLAKSLVCVFAANQSRTFFTRQAYQTSSTQEQSRAPTGGLEVVTPLGLSLQRVSQ